MAVDLNKGLGNVKQTSLSGLLKTKKKKEEQQNGSPKQEEVTHVDTIENTVKSELKKDSQLEENKRPLSKPRNKVKKPFESTQKDKSDEEKKKAFASKEKNNSENQNEINLTPVKTLQLQVLRSQADEDGVFSLSQKDLQNLFSIKCRKQVKSIISYFLEKNLITVHQEHDANKGISTKYRIM